MSAILGGLTMLAIDSVAVALLRLWFGGWCP